MLRNSNFKEKSPQTVPKWTVISSFIDFIFVLHQVLEAGSANISTRVLVYLWFIINNHHVSDSNISADESK